MKASKYNMICFLLIILLFSYYSIALTSDIWISVVLLNINGYKCRKDYELVDTGETVLPGLVSLGKLLDAEVFLNPDKMTAEVNCPWNNTTTTLDLNRQLAVVSGKEIEMVPEALAAYGDYFIPLPVAERIFQAEIEWNSLAQALDVNVERQLSLFETAEAAEETAKADNQEIEIQREPDIRMPFFTFGSVQYELEQWYSLDSENAMPGKLNFDMHMQAGGVPVDIFLQSDNFLSNDRDLKIKKAQATYTSSTRRIVLGDTSVKLGKILETTPIRGLSYTAPPCWNEGSLRAFTEIEGEVEVGSEVMLTVNDHYFGKKTADDGYYVFDSIPLQILNANEVKITILTPEGKEIIETRTITATPRLLGAGLWESAAGIGMVTDEERDSSGDILAGGALRYGLMRQLTVGGAVAGQIPLEEEKPGRLAGEVGLAFRASDNIIFSLDWLVSKGVDTESDLSNGLEAEASFIFERFAVQSIIFYREADLHLFKKNHTNNVKGYQLIAEYEINEKMSVEMSYLDSRLISGEGKPSQEIKAAFRWKPTSRSSYTLAAEHQVGVSDRIEMNYKYINSSLEAEIELAGNCNITDDRHEFSSVESKIEAIKSLPRFMNDSLNSKIARSDKMSILLPGKNRQYENETALDLSWHPGEYVINPGIEYKEVRILDIPQDTVREGKVSLDLSRKFKFVNVGLGLGLEQSSGYDFTERSLYNSLQIGTTVGDFSGKVKLEYNTPLDKQNRSGYMEGSLKLKYGFSNGIQLGLEAYAEPDDFEEMVYSVGFTVSQRIGFSNGGIKGFNKFDGRPLDYVEGFVYVDINLNGKRDKGEKTLGNIPVTLNGQRKFTGEDGYYCFNNVTPGIYRLGLDITKLPADYTPLTEKKLIELPANANFTMDFGLALYGTAEGIVFIDFNGNGKLDRDEQTPEWVKVLVDSEKECYTDSRGRFTFGSLGVGEHTLTVDTANFPSDIKAPEPIIITITEEALDAWGILLPLTIKNNF